MTGQLDSIMVANMLEWNAVHDAVYRSRAEATLGTPHRAEDMALWWFAPSKAVVVRNEYDSTYLDDVRQFLAPHSIDVHRVPDGVESIDISGQLVDRDGLVARGLSEKIAWTPGSTVLIDAWGSTLGLLRLIDCLRKSNPHCFVDGPVATAEQLWLMQYVDGKTGGRAVLSVASALFGGFVVPPALHLGRGQDPVKTVESAMKALGDVVLKAEYGSGGRGVHFVHVGSSREAWEEIARVDSSSGGPILVEQLVGQPNDLALFGYNGVVTSNGSAVEVGVGEPLIERGREYGTVLGRAVEPGALDAVRGCGRNVGLTLAALGYSGRYNVDLVYRKSDETLFAVEINPRRTGSLTVMDIARGAFGDKWNTARCAVAIERLDIDTKYSSYASVRERLRLAGLFGRGDGVDIFPHIVSGLDVDHCVGLWVGGSDIDSVASALGSVCDTLGGSVNWGEKVRSSQWR